MGAAFQYDDGPVLLVTCDSCAEQIVAFNTHESTRTELDTRIAAEAWEFQGGSSWLCKTYGSGTPRTDIPDRLAAISVLRMPY
jgi:hypothetical protein